MKKLSVLALVFILCLSCLVACYDLVGKNLEELIYDYTVLPD